MTFLIDTPYGRAFHHRRQRDGTGLPHRQDVALVYGAGPMGLVTVQALKGVYKVKQVIVVDRIDERLKMAQRSGADWVLNNGEQSLQAALDEKASSRR